MRLHNQNIRATLSAVLLAVSLLTPCLQLAVEVAGQGRAPQAVAPYPAQQQQQPQIQTGDSETSIEARDENQNGITVSEPKIYDDALLQQMLSAAEARLATLQLIDQTSIASRLGAVTGASQNTSALGLNIQGPSVPGIVTTTKLPTETTTEGSQTTAAGATSTSLQTVSNLAVQDQVTTRSPFSPPTAVAPAPTTTLPSSFSVSSSDILNEQLQLSAEINGLRLLLSGSLSDYFIKHRPDQQPIEPELPKLKSTLGFNVTVTPDRRYKDAVAIVEAEVQALQPISSELPAITALIPREKTYNVAAITDKSTSIGGGVATQILGFSGSWVRGHKTYYLVQDQDTVALTFSPTDNRKTGFRWQFRPVLGQRFVKAGLKQTFVQLAFPTVQDAIGGEIGRVTVRTYWRRYDRKAGILNEVVPGSYREMYRDVDISSFKQPVMPIAFNPVAGLEDLGGGQMLVKLDGRFLPGTYVRIGASQLIEGAGLQHDYHGLKFNAPIALLATRNVYLVAHDGTEVLLNFTDSNCSPGKEPVIRDPIVTPIDDSTSRLKVRVIPAAFGAKATLPRPVFVIGQRVFGHADAPLTVEEQDVKGEHMVFLSAVVPNAVYTPTAELVVKPLFAPPGCTSNGLPIGGLKPPSAERLTPLEQNDTELKYILTGTGLSTIQVLSPADARLERIGPASEADKLLLLILKPIHLKTNKQVYLQKGDARPFLVTIPEFEPKKPAPPQALGSIDLKANAILIVGDGMNEVESVTFNGLNVTFKALDDKNLLLSDLQAVGVTTSAGTKRFFIKFKSEAKPKEVDVNVATEIVNTKQ